MAKVVIAPDRSERPYFPFGRLLLWVFARGLRPSRAAAPRPPVSGDLNTLGWKPAIVVQRVGLFFAVAFPGCNNTCFRAPGLLSCFTCFHILRARIKIPGQTDVKARVPGKFSPMTLSVSIPQIKYAAGAESFEYPLPDLREGARNVHVQEDVASPTAP